MPDDTDTDTDDEATPQTHISEREYATEVAKPWLEAAYGAENVRHEVTLAASDRRADFIVEGKLATWACEVENDEESVIEAVGQSLLYAAHRPSWRPCIIIPPGHFEQPERDMLDEHVRIIELPPDRVGEE